MANPNNAVSSFKAGITLVEAVLALAILSIGVFVLMETAARCLAVARMSKNYQTARLTLDLGEMEYPLVATNELDKIAVAPVAYPNGYTYSREATATDGEEQLICVKTRVSWSEAGKDSHEELVSYVFCPKKGI